MGFPKNKDNVDWFSRTVREKVGSGSGVCSGPLGGSAC